MKLKKNSNKVVSKSFFMVKMFFFNDKNSAMKIKKVLSVKLDLQKMIVLLFELESCAPEKKIREKILGLNNFH